MSFARRLLTTRLIPAGGPPIPCPAPAGGRIADSAGGGYGNLRANRRAGCNTGFEGESILGGSFTQRRKGKADPRGIRCVSRRSEYAVKNVALFVLSGGRRFDRGFMRSVRLADHRRKTTPQFALRSEVRSRVLKPAVPLRLCVNESKRIRKRYPAPTRADPIRACR